MRSIDMMPMLRALEAEEQRREDRRKQIIRNVLDGLNRGLTIRAAAAAAGIHVSTLYRWRKNDKWLSWDLLDGMENAYLERHTQRERARPPLVRHPLCPACGATAVPRTAHFHRRFWGCSKWPECKWASWRPRHPEDCSTCGGPRYWSRHGRIVRCPACEPWPLQSPTTTQSQSAACKY